MARRARKRSSTGIYHIILRGINRQIIFEDDEDCQRLLGALKQYREDCGYEIYAYCLMSNHIHLLFKEGEEDLGITFRRLGASYVYWYNRKYNRSGYLFQGRYKSETVESDAYFLTVLRYIHQNPLKAKIVNNIVDYSWSSYREYIGRPRICNTEFALSLFSEDRAKAVKLFKEFNLTENNDQYLEYDQNRRLNDIEAINFIKSISGIQGSLEIQGLERKICDNIIKKCKAQGLSIRQIERLTGVSFGVIRRI